LEFQRNVERYAFLRWGQTAFQNFKVVPRTPHLPPGEPGIPGAVVCAMPTATGLRPIRFGRGTDSHTTMVNALGVFGWASADRSGGAMLGQPSSMLIPEVVGFRLHGR